MAGRTGTGQKLVGLLATAVFIVASALWRIKPKTTMKACRARSFSSPNIAARSCFSARRWRMVSEPLSRSHPSFKKSQEDCCRWPASDTAFHSAWVHEHAVSSGIGISELEHASPIKHQGCTTSVAYFVRKRVGSSHHKRASINPYAEPGAFRAAACYVLFPAGKRNIGTRRRKLKRIGTSRTTGAVRVNAPSRMNWPARKILLATDLSARCDRALSRAAMLAEQWHWSLLVLHVVEDRDLSIPDAAGLPSWRRSLDPFDIARKQLLGDVDALAARPTMRIAEGNPADVILCSADAERCDLIAIGVGRDEPLGHFMLDRTANRLFRRSPVPLLVVKDRPRKPYANIVFATDLSASSRYALEATARLFSGQKLTVFHAYRPPSGLMTESALHRQYRMEVEQEVRAFLAGVDKSAPGWQPPHVLIEDGAPNLLLRDYVRDNEVDLLVLGSHGRNPFFEMLLGNTAKVIVDDVPCDALVIRQPRAAAET